MAPYTCLHAYMLNYNNICFVAIPQDEPIAPCTLYLMSQLCVPNVFQF